ncbi:hypothetical protein PHLCEN_2v5951 [Hermanssonia centrifuga]|uniref:Uncharacterized protein n=1 Tax=Hermanssonia centrifuga TaxID=98765 RepID=A0A2R6P1H8_9APHY|nr:hypothetical protein PHLCEN_2v5951 [Hermanssonia centrifuga]
MPQRRRRSSVSQRQSAKNGGHSMSERTPSRSVTFRPGKCLRIHWHANPTYLTPHILRLTAAKEEGAVIEIDGKKVALGIPGGKSAATGGDKSGSTSAYPGIPLARGGTPDEAAASILL